MGWKRYFTPVDVSNTSGTYSPIGSNSSKPGPARNNYSSFLPEVYTGSPNRVDRYLQYATMDMDSEITAALDILAEFCSQPNDENLTPFTLQFKNKATNSEIMILREYMQQWSKLQQFTTRIFKIVRNTFKNGDCFFIRDPETQKWYYIDPTNVVKVIVNESEGKKPEQYVIKGLSPNFQSLVVTTINPGIVSNRGETSPIGGPASRGIGGAYPQNPSSSGSRFSVSQDELAVDAKHIVHISLSEGIDNNFPFGTSLLESVFKVYKQKELLEDAIIIYRIQRAPERRIFYIDVGNMPSHLAMSYVERVKNEIHQRRIPTSSGGTTSIDSAYNPISVGEDYYFPHTCLSLTEKIKLLDGRDVSLQDIIDEFESGKENFVYTVNQNTLEIEPGKIVWAGKTRLNTQVLRVTLDDGSSVKVTPDHRFIMRDGSEKEAQDLLIGDLVKTRDFEIEVKSIEWLEEFEDTGDLTIEGNHNFALSIGVFIHNSEGRGSKVETLPGGCLAMDTKVKLLDGRDLSISEIEQEMIDGKELWTNSCEPLTGKIVPGIISWAGVTQSSAKVLKLSLSNNTEIVCTPCHKFPTYDLEYKRAGEFVVGDVLMPLSEPVMIIGIEHLDEEIEVGTLTIDQNEIHHDYHTFSLSCGVFVFNSNLGEIADLQFFTNKLFRGLRIPSSYLPIGAEDSQQQYTDGRVGTAYIQELRFNKYCERLQNLMQPVFDQEFKLFLNDRGVNIDSSLFEIKFQPPQNFASYRQAELDNQRIPTFTQILAVPIVSKRFALKRFLGLTDEEIAENERLWAEENGEGKPVSTDSSGELRNIGLSQSGIQSDIGMMNDQNLGAPEGTEPATMTEPSTVTPPPGEAQ